MTRGEEDAFALELAQLMAELEEERHEAEGEDWFMDDWHPRYVSYMVRAGKVSLGLSPAD